MSDEPKAVRNFGMHRVQAPFTPEQVRGLQEFQDCDRVHPFTCPGDDSCPDRKLIPTDGGWLCACGQYHQDWAWSFMLKGAPPICDVFGKDIPLHHVGRSG